MIGIIGFGMVGQAVARGFDRIDKFIVDPEHSTNTIQDLLVKKPKAIFVCVPTDADDPEFALLTGVLDQLAIYDGLVIVKSTALPHVLESRPIVYNPEFLTRATAHWDFQFPCFLLLGGDRAQEALEFYRSYSNVNTKKVFLTDIKTASLCKYMMNSFYATKVTFMNQFYDVAKDLGCDWSKITNILSAQPWMGTHHFQVPGPDGHRGFGGPCLPKDTARVAEHYGLALLTKVLEINKEYRHADHRPSNE